MRIDLQEWIRGAEECAQRQAMFVRDDVLPVVNAGLRYEERRGATVIGEHMSKRVRLPVYEVRREDLGLRLVMRNNFNDWKLSVDSPDPISDGDGLLPSLFHTDPPVEPEYTGDELHRVYFEGFAREDIYRYYRDDHRLWSASIATDYRLWTIMRELGAVRPKAWRTRASHAAEMPAARINQAPFRGP